MRQPAKTNWRLLRIAEQICSCLLTDGFCGPQNRPDCRCWTAARAAVQGLENQSDPALEAAWPLLGREERRGRLNALVEAIKYKKDELTDEHAKSLALSSKDGQ
jgi:hypothetical protein